MNKKILLGLSVLGMSAALNSDDDVALVNYGEFNPEAMRTLVSGATEACTADPECAAKMESAVDVPPPEQAPADSGATPGSSGAADTPANSSPSTTPTSSPAGTSSSGTSPNTNPTVSSSSTAPNTNPTVSSSSTQQQQTQSSSSQQQTQPSSSSQNGSGSGGGEKKEINSTTSTSLAAGTYTVTCSGANSISCWTGSGDVRFTLNGENCDAKKESGWSNCGHGSCSASEQTLVTPEAITCQSMY